MRSRCWMVCDAYCSVCCMLEVVLYALEMLEGRRRVLPCMLEAVEGDLCSLEAMHCVLLCICRLWSVSSVRWRCWR